MEDENKCFSCGKPLEYLPYVCRYCGESFCSEHRLPEKHECGGLEKWKRGELKKFKKPVRTIKTTKPFLEPYDWTVKPTRRINTKIFWIILLIAVILIFYYLYSLGFSIKFLNESRSTRIDISATTTTIQKPPEIDIGQLEKDVHDLINEERKNHDLSILKWNDDIAKVARSHSRDMALTIFAHEDLSGLNVDGRLLKAEINYWNKTGENIFKINIEKSCTVYMIDHTETSRVCDYYTQDSLAKEILNSWVNSKGHRENILTKDFDEEGIGIYVDSNGNYFVTEDLITRADCGYKNGPCCPSPPGYLPSCYVPYDCTSGVCR